MAWIRSVPEGDEAPQVKLAYDYIRSVSATGRVANVLQAQGLHPRALEWHYRLYRELMFGPSPLSRAQREMIAVAVSATNGCHY
jgi:alkylhydroperoxidase family enzyme